jgi:hypothetical protein
VSLQVSQIPVFVIVRDRISGLQQLLAYLERAGMENISLLDNDSTYPPCLDYLRQTPHRVLRLGQNLGHLALFEQGLCPPGHFILSDPDLIPLGPPDGVEHLWEVSQRYPGKAKWGFGLSLEGASPRTRGYAWEQELWAPSRQLAPGIFDAPIDTTFALYPPATGREPRQRHSPAIRTGPPYVMRHPDWEYRPGDWLSPEDEYYHRRALANSASTLGSAWVEENGRLKIRG